MFKPKRNGRSDQGHRGRRWEGELIRNLGYGGWTEREYGRRCVVETAYSMYKRVFGEKYRVKSCGSIARELACKVTWNSFLLIM